VVVVVVGLAEPPPACVLRPVLSLFLDPAAMAMLLLRLGAASGAAAAAAAAAAVVVAAGVVAAPGVGAAEGGALGDRVSILVEVAAASAVGATAWGGGCAACSWCALFRASTAVFVFSKTKAPGSPLSGFSSMNSSP